MFLKFFGGKEIFSKNRYIRDKTDIIVEKWAYLCGIAAQGDTAYISGDMRIRKSEFFFLEKKIIFYSINKTLITS
jgi:hypothetical protein